MIPRIRAAILELDDYPERDLRDAGIRIRLHRNEAALEAPEHVVEALQSIDGDLLRRYPTELGYVVTRLLAKRLDTSPERVALANGADEALGALARVFLEPGDEAIAPSPAFGMYARVAAIAGAHLRQIPYCERWRLDPELFAASANGWTRLVFLGHPNNPTGDALRASDLDAIVRALPNVAIVVDEVYLALSQLSLVRISQRYANVIVVGSLSKSASLAGARVGYAVAEPEIAAALRRTLPPYPLAVGSLVAAEAYLGNAAATAAFETRLCAQTERSLNALESGIGPFAQSIARGPANFLLAEFGDRAPVVWKALDAAGIRARLFDAPQLSGAIRFCAASDAETEATIACLRAAMRELAYA
jgi:histidinol-phosphate aminotransferase